MITKKLNKKNRKYIITCFSLLLTFWLISLFEYTSIFFSGKETPGIFNFLVFKFFNHFYTVIFIYLIFLPFYYLFSRKKTRKGLLIIRILFVLIIFIELALTKYSLTTLLNLGADLLGYSLDDIYLTVSSSGSSSILFFITFLIFPAVFLSSCFFLRKAEFFKYCSRIFLTAALIVLILKFVLPGFSNSIYQNKIYFFVVDVLKYQKGKIDVKSIKLEGNKEYPFLKPSEKIADVLSPFFNVSAEKPNIVIIQVEGLGAEFVGDSYYSGFTPYLNSLISESLYWPNFLSNAGRTFGALPSLMASLPFGEKGFLEIEEIPTHLSLFSVLKQNDYSTSFFAGDQSSFDKKINFLEHNGVENIIDENKYDETYPKSVNSSNGFSWGYSDYEIFKKTLSVLDDIPSPRLDLIATQSIHDPFTFPVKQKYLLKIDSILKTNKSLKATKKQIRSNKDIFASILYSDASVKMFIESYKKRPDFKNTIFIITGDHRLIPIAQKDKLCRFNVPFFIYSPLLKKPTTMKAVNSHYDLAPSLLSFLSNSYDLDLPKETAWLGDGIDTSKTFRNIHKIPLMRYKGSLSDYVYKDYLLSDGKLYKIKEDFNIYQIDDKTVLNDATKSFNEFKNLNAYVTKNNKIYPENENTKIKGIYIFTPEELTKIEELTNGLTVDEMFMAARQKAFNNERETARLICNYILKKVPNYVDVRILKGRTLAWDGQYEASEKELLNALKRSPYYDDIYLALLDMYWWSSQNEKSIVIVDKAIKNKIKNDDVAFKMARAYATMKNTDKATTIIDSILKKQPKNKVYLKLKKSL
ncbi:sulfatase-like hydrolase/transferase [Polaribacter sp. Asnod6-C07]|uniref:sulfatase-like hydrolase/transferase n=1 Tax=Polaribacter sp. Asnod6-C07 TaxID=3160582 RepID=UPI00386680B3